MKVLLTQSPGRLDGLAERLQALGHQVERRPLLVTEPLDDPQTRAGLAALAACPWLLFTSPAAVDAWAGLGGPFTARVGVVGPGTAARVHGHGGRVALVASPETGRGLAESFLKAGHSGPVGFPRGQRGGEDLSATLAAAGVAVVPLVVYRSANPPAGQLGPANVTLVASPSALAALPWDLACGTRLVALGPSTAAAARARGLACLTAPHPGVEGALEAILAADPATRGETDPAPRGETDPAPRGEADPAGPAAGAEKEVSSR